MQLLPVSKKKKKKQRGGNITQCEGPEFNLHTTKSFHRNNSVHTTFSDTYLLVDIKLQISRTVCFQFNQSINDLTKNELFIKSKTTKLHLRWEGHLTETVQTTEMYNYSWVTAQIENNSYVSTMQLSYEFLPKFFFLFFVCFQYWGLKQGH